MSATPNQVIDTITLAMSQLSALEDDDRSLEDEAWYHLSNARKLLVAKYIPNTEEIGR